jgi:hypothetical protein
MKYGHLYARHPSTRTMANPLAFSLRRKLRSKLLKTQKKCVISGWSNPLELQMAHIIPKMIGYKIGFNGTDTESNCILLSNNLHTLFDNFEWTVDIFSFMDINSECETHFKSTILIHKLPKPGQSSLSGCQDHIFIIPIRYYASFYAHYYTYLQNHYTSRPVDREDCFRRCVGTPMFKALRELTTVSAIKTYILGLRNISATDDCTCTIVTAHQTENALISKYRVLWNLWSWGYSTWGPRSSISDSLHNRYEDYVEDLNDPEWTPP